MELAEHEKHVAQTRVDLLGSAWCGVLLVGMWAFTGVDHAALNGLERGRLRPCPACLVAIVEALRS